MTSFYVQLWTKVLSKQSGHESGFLINAPVQVLTEGGKFLHNLRERSTKEFIYWTAQDSEYIY